MSDLQAEALTRWLLDAGRGDQLAFARLYRASSAKLFGVALRILQRRDWAEEVLQDAFVRVWEHAAGFDPAKSAPMTWMTHIVRNRAIDWLRRPHELALDDDAFEQWESRTPDEQPGLLERLMANRDGVALARCMEALAASERQSVVLAYLHGLSHSELASHLSVPLGTVKSWVRRGLEKLKGCLSA